VYSLPGLDTSGLVALLLSFPDGPAGLASSSVLVGARKSTRSQCFHGWILVRGDNLKVRPTEHHTATPPWNLGAHKPRSGAQFFFVFFGIATTLITSLDACCFVLLNRYWGTKCAVFMYWFPRKCAK